jgi:3-oxoadipate enol-lactonase
MSRGVESKCEAPCEAHYNSPVMIKVANLPSRRVRYLEAGGGEPLVLLHAFPLNAEQWLPQLTRVPAGWRVVAPDLRGFRAAEGEGSPAPVSMDTYAADVLELMSHLEIPRAVVAGLSMGGYVALAIVRLAAPRLSGLVLADTRAGADGPEARTARDEMLRLVDREGAGGVARAMIPKLLGETTRREQPDLADAVARLIESAPPGGIASAIRALRDRPDSNALLPRIGCPTTIICGEEDSVTPPSESEAMHRAIAGSRLVLLPRAGHLSNLENPRAFSDALFSLTPRHAAAANSRPDAP